MKTLSYLQRLPCLLWFGQKEQYTVKEKQTLINKLLSKTMSLDL